MAEMRNFRDWAQCHAYRVRWSAIAGGIAVLYMIAKQAT